MQPVVVYIKTNIIAGKIPQTERYIYEIHCIAFTNHFHGTYPRLCN